MILGMDIGGSAVKFGMVTESGEIVSRHEAPVDYDGYRTPILTTILRETEAFLRSDGHTVEGIGVSATGQVDDRTGEIIGSNGSIPGYDGTPFKAALEDAFHIPVWVLNDANAAVLGEAFTGAAKGYQDVLMITLGTGVGGGVISGGHLLSGRRGIAGELGHFPIDRNGTMCTCGCRGCYERYASTSAMLIKARQCSKEPVPNGRAVFARAAAGDESMLKVLSAWVDDITVGLVGLIHIFNPELVLIGGGVSRQEELLIEPIRKAVLPGLMPRFAEGLRIEAASLGNDAGLIGAVRYYLDKAE